MERNEKGKLRIGSRESRLAVVQSQWIIALIKDAFPDLEIELVTMKTTGDKILDRTLDKVGGKGLFVKELDKAMMDNRIDLSVHSLKDMPSELPEGIHIGAYSVREDPRDALVLPAGVKEPDPKKPIGCASQRRALQLTGLYPELQVKPVRGNVLTRLEKLDRGEYGGLVLACAGLKRLGLAHRITRVFSPEEMIPAPGQGILAVESRIGEQENIIRALDNQESRLAATAERAFIKTLDGGCSSPIAAYGQLENGRLALRGLYCLEGRTDYVEGTLSGSPEEGTDIGIQLAEKLKKQMEAKG